MFCMQDENVEDTSNGSNDRQIGTARVHCSVLGWGAISPLHSIASSTPNYLSRGAGTMQLKGLNELC